MDDIDDIRRRLSMMGYALFEVPGGYVIKSLYYKSLTAGTEAEPLTLAQVRQFAA